MDGLAHTSARAHNLIIVLIKVAVPPGLLVTQLAEVRRECRRESSRRCQPTFYKNARDSGKRRIISNKAHLESNFGGLRVADIAAAAAAAAGGHAPPPEQRWRAELNYEWKLLKILPTAEVAVPMEGSLKCATRRPGGRSCIFRREYKEV
jgi:hypothetical protein